MVYPLRIARPLGRQIKTLARRSKLSEADVMRLSITRGLPGLEEFFKKTNCKVA